MNEFGIIRDYFAPLTITEKGALGLQDDAAVLSIPHGMELIITQDAITQGVHFLGDEPAAQIAQKLLRVNLSDLAAMGATPYVYFISLMLPETVEQNWIQSFAEGLAADQNTFAITLAGGDTTHTKGLLSLSLTALGLVEQGKAMKRSGAMSGDNIYVTGTIGDAALGLKVAGHPSSAVTDYLLGRYRLPIPRINTGKALCGIASSCIDISDGLLQDLGHIANTSHVAARVEWESIPLSHAARSFLPQCSHPEEIIAGGGDDYELLFTAPPHQEAALAHIARTTGTDITCIGRITDGQGVNLIDRTGKAIYVSQTGYRHFRD